MGAGAVCPAVMVEIVLPVVILGGDAAALGVLHMLDPILFSCAQGSVAEGLLFGALDMRFLAVQAHGFAGREGSGGGSGFDPCALALLSGLHALLKRCLAGVLGDRGGGNGKKGCKKQRSFKGHGWVFLMGWL